MPVSNPERTVQLAAASIGAVRIGIEQDAVVHAIPAPAAPAFLPRREGVLQGVVLHDGVLVPVLDLARWVDVGTAPPSGQAGARVLILRDGARTIGLQVDTIDGLAGVPQGAIARLHHDDRADEVFHSAAHVPETGQVLSLLDVGRLADLAASWHHAGDGDPAAQAVAAAVAAGPDTARPQHALLQLDAVRLGVPAGDLVEVMPMPILTRFGGAIDSTYCRWRGRDLPVLASGAIEGLPDACSAPLLAVIEHAGLVLGLPVRSALALQAMAGQGVPDAGGLTAAVYDDSGTEVRLLDTAALFARFPEALLSKPDTAASDSAPAHDGGAATTCAYIVYEAGACCATPISTVEQILLLSAGEAAGATMEWRGAAIPLVDLRPAAPDGAAPASGGHVLVAAGAAPVGYVVTRVDLLVPAGSARLYRLGADPERALAFITVDAAEGAASYRIADLARAAS
jgi:chemotaxis signal transduction protein